MKWLGNSCGCGNVGMGMHVFYTRDYNFKATSEKCAVLRCQYCGSLYSERFPSVESLAEAYGNYYTNQMRHSGLRRIFSRLLNLTRQKYMLRCTPRNAHPILDYGCGAGEFLSTLKNEGFDSGLYGTDIIKPDIAANMGFDWLPLEWFDVPDRSYAWITMSHVIEHLVSADMVLARLANVMTKGGSIWISTPNADSVLIRCFKGCARDIDFPRHRQIYSKKALEEMLVKAGFSVQFLSAPRINAILNFNSCAKNIWACEEMATLEKLRVILASGIRVIWHLALPQRYRVLESPELVLIGNYECQSSIN